MDAIDPNQFNYIPQKHEDRKKVEKKKKTGKSRFSNVFESGKPGFIEFTGLNQEVDLEELVDAVHEAGERLKEKPVYSNITAYKKAVGEFLRFIIEHGLEADEIEGTRLSIFKKQKKYMIIRKIDEGLDKLAAGILQNQLSQLNILAKVEEIQGLIVDLLS